MSTLTKIRTNLTYAFDTTGFRPVVAPAKISPSAIRSAKQIRGADRPASIMIHGIMPRCGSVYTGSLLSLHPDLNAYPQQLWEVPFVQQAKRIEALQTQFEADYVNNQGKLGQQDFLPIFGAAFVAHLHSFVPDEQRMMLKMPSMQHLDRFYDVFPHENLLLVVRDGRDVVRSTLKSWPSISFVSATLRWRRSAEMAHALQQRFAGQPNFLYARFEDIIQNPAAFVGKVSAQFGLDAAQFPFAEIENLPVRGSSSTRKKGEAVHWQAVEKKKGFTPIGRWQTWPRWKKLLFKQLSGDALALLDYDRRQDW